MSAANWLSIGEDLAGLSERLGLYPRERAAAASRALNRSISTVRKQGSIWLRADYAGIKVSQLKARMNMRLSTQRTLTAELVFSGKRFALYDNFGMHTFGKFGVSFSRLPWRIETVSGETVTPEMLARAYRNRSTRSGKPLVFSRHTKVRTSQEVLVAPGLARALEERGYAPALLKVGRERFSEVFVQEATYRLSQR